MVFALVVAMTPARGEGSHLRYYAKARHRAAEPQEPVGRASDEEVLALLRACRSARDRFIVLLLARAGLRRSEAVGMRREDIHFILDASVLGCRIPGSHLHVVRRDNDNGAWAKSKRSRAVPVDFLLVQATTSTSSNETPAAKPATATSTGRRHRVPQAGSRALLLPPLLRPAARRRRNPA
ncbi:tyrosine-type recombinase/integrase [Streptomyces sp. NPDC023998]|uniref:tyrosine-type recombinase/integrase n=1 Tax=Streptomyces sp. NPDC023998 TaxID=3154597 RepID=UPI0033CDB9F5